MKEITLIAGKLNNGEIRYWNKNGQYIDVGDYVIVENLKGFDLVQVIAEVQTTENIAKMFFTKGHELKNVVKHVYNLGFEDAEK